MNFTDDMIFLHPVRHFDSTCKFNLFRFRFDITFVSSLLSINILLTPYSYRFQHILDEFCVDCVEMWEKWGKYISRKNITEFLHSTPNIWSCKNDASQEEKWNKVWICIWIHILKKLTLHFWPCWRRGSTFNPHLPCSSRPRVYAGEVGSQRCAHPAQRDHSLSEAWWWDIERFHRPTSRPRSGPGLRTSRQRRAARLWRSLPRAPDTPAEPPSDSFCQTAGDSRLSLWMDKWVHKQIAFAYF